MKLRRQLFDWEVDQWNCFLAFLHNIVVRRLIHDTIASSFEPNGFFSMKSFSKRLESSESTKVADFNDVWQSICPRKVEVFCVAGDERENSS